MVLGLVTLGHVNLDGSKFKANSSKHFALSLKLRQEKEAVLLLEIETMITRVMPSLMRFTYQSLVMNSLQYSNSSHKVLNTVRAASGVLEAQELAKGQTVDDIIAFAQISFTHTDACIMESNGQFDSSHLSQKC